MAHQCIEPPTRHQNLPAEVVAAEIHKWYEVTRILNASPHDWCPPVPNAAWVEQQASVRLPCQRAERHRALLVAHPVRNALRHTLCPTPQRCGEAACAWPPRLPRPRSSLRHSNRTRRSSRSVRIRSCAAWPTRRAGKLFVYHPTAQQVWCGNERQRGSGRFV